MKGLKERIKYQEEKIARCDEMLLNKDVDRETHQGMISKLKEEITIWRKRLNCKKAEKQGVRK